MNKLFNTEFETSLRLILLLKIAGKSGLSVDRAAIADYAAIYSKNCGLSDKNLNGDAVYSFSEFATKRLLVSNALITMVRCGIANVRTTGKGFIYVLSEDGKIAASKMQSSYATSYLRFAKESLGYFKNVADDRLMDSFNSIASRAMSEVHDD